jgi:hypothetical protein
MRRLALAALLAAGPAATEPPACWAEAGAAARTACLDAETDRLLLEMEGRLSALAAVSPDMAALRAQAAWQRAMEADCAALTHADPQRTPLARAVCRHAAARTRRHRLDRALSVAAGGGGLFGPLWPELEILVTPRRR